MKLSFLSIINLGLTLFSISNLGWAIKGPSYCAMALAKLGFGGPYTSSIRTPEPLQRQQADGSEALNTRELAQASNADLSKKIMAADSHADVIKMIYDAPTRALDISRIARKMKIFDDNQMQSIHAAALKVEQGEPLKVAQATETKTKSTGVSPKNELHNFKQGDLIQFSLTDPYGSNPNQVVTRTGVFKGTLYDGRVIEFTNWSAPAHLIKGPFTVIKPALTGQTLVFEDGRTGTKSDRLKPNQTAPTSQPTGTKSIVQGFKDWFAKRFGVTRGTSLKNLSEPDQSRYIASQKDRARLNPAFEFFLESPGFLLAMKHLYIQLDEYADVPIGAKAFGWDRKKMAAAGLVDGRMFYRVIEKDPKLAADLIVDTMGIMLNTKDLIPKDDGHTSNEYSLKIKNEIHRRATEMKVSPDKYIETSEKIWALLDDPKTKAELTDFLIKILPEHGPTAVKQALAF